MALSKRMVFTLQDLKPSFQMQYRKGDGRTLRALARRGILKQLRWDRYEHCYRFRLTAHGIKVKRLVSGLTTVQVKEIL